MKLLSLTLLAFAFLSVAAPAAFAKCDHANDTASDGSRCGGRAADQRPGGR